MSEDDNVPRWRGQPGMYEAWYLTFTDPMSGGGYWIRSSILSADRGPASAGVWFARFDRGDPDRVLGIHRRVPLEALTVANGVFQVSVGDVLMRSGEASGEVSGGGHTARWDLVYATGEPTYRLLPGAFYRGPLAPTKPYSPNPSTRFGGTIEVDGERIELVDAPGQQGHLYGARHAERWAWAHCSDFSDEEAVVQALTAQQRRGPFRSPYATFVGIRWRGKWIRLGKFGRQRDFGLGTWKVNVENRRYRLTGRIEAPARAMLRARYEDPDGTPRYCHHSGVAASRLALFERRAGGFEEVALLESRGTTQAEWAGRTPAPQVERELVEVTS